MKVFGISKLFVNLFDDGLTLGGVLIAMLLWSAVYLILSWYIERIFPGEYGIKLPFYFPFMVFHPSFILFFSSILPFIRIIAVLLVRELQQRRGTSSFEFDE